MMAMVMMMAEGQISIAANMSHHEIRGLMLIPRPVYAPTRDPCCAVSHFTSDDLFIGFALPGHIKDSVCAVS